jgi:putative ABC transport system permease protein
VGASSMSILILLSKDFLVLVFIASIIAWPLMYFVMNNWLSQYTYRTGVSFNIFLGSSLIIALITLIVISYHTIKAALSNPVDALSRRN